MFLLIQIGVHTVIEILRKNKHQSLNFVQNVEQNQVLILNFVMNVDLSFEGGEKIRIAKKTGETL